MIKVKFLKKAALLTLCTFIWLLLTENFNFARLQLERDTMKNAWECFEKSDYDCAIKLAKNITQTSPIPGDAANAYYLIARIHHEMGEDDKVFTNIRHVFDTYPPFTFEEKNQEFKTKVESIKKQAAEELYSNAEDHYRNNEYLKAEEYLKKVFMMFPDFSKEEKVPGFKEFVNQVKKKMAAEILYKKAKDCFYNNDYDCFKENMKKTLEIYPDLPIKETAKKFLREIEKIKKELAEEAAKKLYSDAKANFANGEYSKADENLQELFRKYPDFFQMERNKKFRKKVKKIRLKVAREFYGKAKDSYQPGDKAGADKFLKMVFSICPDFSKKDETDSEFKKFVKEKRVQYKPVSNVIAKEKGCKKKKFPWLIVAAGVVIVAVLALIPPKPTPTKYNLTVNKGEGVDGIPASGTYEYNEGTNVNYSYSLQSGYSNLTVTLDGNVVASTGTITMNRNHQLNAVSTELGRINVTSIPTGANIFLDGVDTGQLTNAVIQNVTPGTHTIRLTLQGYEPAEQTVEVVAGEERPVDITLTRSYTNIITINGKLGTLASGQDENTGQDAYQFYVAENCNLTIQVDSEGHIRPEFALLPSANTAPGNVLVGGSGRGERITYTVTTSGKYYVVAIEDETPDADEKAGTYTITITSNKKSLGDYQQIIDEGAETLAIVLTGKN